MLLGSLNLKAPDSGAFFVLSVNIQRSGVADFRHPSAALLLLALTSLLTGCSTNPNVLQMHKVTAEAIGLASTD